MNFSIFLSSAYQIIDGALTAGNTFSSFTYSKPKRAFFPFCRDYLQKMYTLSKVSFFFELFFIISSDFFNARRKFFSIPPNNLLKKIDPNLPHKLMIPICLQGSELSVKNNLQIMVPLAYNKLFKIITNTIFAQSAFRRKTGEISKASYSSKIYVLNL